jgi:hypothetical protein
MGAAFFWLGNFLVRLYFKLWQLHVYIVQNLFNWTRTGWVWVVAIVGIMVGLVTRTAQSMGDVVTWLITQTQALFTDLPTGNIGQSGISDVLAVGNFLAPLEEGFTFIVFLCSLKLACVTVRIIKSLIPTIS